MHPARHACHSVWGIVLSSWRVERLWICAYAIYGFSYVRAKDGFGGGLTTRVHTLKTETKEE